MSEIYKAKSAEEGPTVSMVRLESGQNTISLDISHGSWDKDGWTLCPLSSPLVSMNVNPLSCHDIIFQLIKEDLDKYNGGQAVPAFQIELKMKEPKPLEEKIEFMGVTPKDTFIMIKRDPKEQGMCTGRGNNISAVM